MKTIKVAVIGVGHLGRFHAEKYKASKQVELVAVCDVDQVQCLQIAAQLKVEAVYDFQELIGKVDAVSIVTPTKTHYAIAKAFLEAGVHVLLEKPFTETLSQADELIKIAGQKKLALQIGHIEQFNPAIQKLKKSVSEPRLIETKRSGAFQNRNLDVSVVLDLMIHDIDIIHTIHDVPIQEIHATGLAIFSNQYDVANARLTFEDGCVAHLSASRVSPKGERTLSVYESDLHTFVDCQAQSISVQKKEASKKDGLEKSDSQKTDTLLHQIESFIASILEKKAPPIDGKKGRRALETALAIHEAIIETSTVIAE